MNINLIADIQEEEETIIIGLTYEEVKWYFDCEPETSSDREWSYIIETYVWGLIKKRLFLFFVKGRVKDYFIGFDL